MDDGFPGLTEIVVAQVMVGQPFKKSELSGQVHLDMRGRAE
jgi:hypothetical protein